MKYIFDFDDVLFHTKSNLKERVFEVYKRHGVSPEQIKEFDAIEGPVRGFSLKRLLAHFSLPLELYHEIMHNNHEYVNLEMLKLAQAAGRENCFIVTYGDEEFQRAKIETAGLENFFREIFVVLDDKKKAVEQICEQFKDEPVIYIDDRERYFNNLDFKQYPNLKTILYTGQTKEEVEKESGLS
ncbi:MAG: HAD hydrolase-like protein [Candidatus Paceibacterota bacterium]|jgi:FMN phosphatase YigB (HAD superfamily)